MSNLFSAEETRFLDRVRTFAESEVWPESLKWDTEAAFPEDIWTRLGSLGLLAMTLPASMGGTGFSCRTYCEACRILAAADPALAMNVAAVNALVVAHIADFGTDEQRAKYLPGIVAGDIRLAWGLTEPDAGSDARRVSTQATPIEGRDGWFHLDGEKMFITNAGRANLIVVIARVSDKELSAFLMETDQPGFELIERIPTVGVRASYTARFKMNRAEAWHTPCSFEEAISLLHRGRLGIAAMALGIAERAFDLMVGYAKQREQFNRRLADMQSVQNMIADSAVELEASRLLLQNAAQMFDDGLPIVAQASMAKLYASETANRVTNRAIQVHGGRGMVPEYRVEKLWRDAKLTEIGEGCSEIQRMVIAKQALK